VKLSTNELLHRRWNEALPGDRATRDGVIYQLSEKGEWLYVEDPYDGQSIRAHKDHAIEAEAVAAERARYTPEAFALALTHIRGAHNADSEDERLSGVPCDWCRLAGEQAAAAVLRIIEGGSE